MNVCIFDFCQFPGVLKTVDFLELRVLSEVNRCTVNINFDLKLNCPIRSISLTVRVA